MRSKQKKIEHDKQVLKDFIGIYCKKNHLKKGSLVYKDGLCTDCFELLNYAFSKLDHCPLDPKPMCKKCQIHCYKKNYRQKIKEIMKFSGIYLIKHGKLNLIFHYYF